MVAESCRAAADAAGTYELATQDLSAEELIGSPVYGPDEENLGEVGDVVFDQAVKSKRSSSMSAASSASARSRSRCSSTR